MVNLGTISVSTYTVVVFGECCDGDNNDEDLCKPCNATDITNNLLRITQICKLKLTAFWLSYTKWVLLSRYYPYKINHSTFKGIWMIKHIY